MTKPEVTKCPGGHFQHVIYTLRPYIADYPEQVLLTGIVGGWCPKYIHAMLYSPYLTVFLDVRPLRQTWTRRLHLLDHRFGLTSWLKTLTGKSCGMIVASILILW